MTLSSRALSPDERSRFVELGAMAREMEPRCCELARMLQDFRRAGEAAGSSQPLEPGISVHLECSPEGCQVRDWMLAPAVLGVDVGCCRMRGAGPRAIIDRVAVERRSNATSRRA